MELKKSFELILVFFLKAGNTVVFTNSTTRIIILVDSKSGKYFN